MSTTSSHPSLFHAIREHKLGPDVCFLCGGGLTADNRTDEHVVPSWAQERYDLSNQRLNLLNKTSIPYRQLTIPCCRDCNETHLGPVEKRVQTAVDGGLEAVKDLQSLDVFIWMGKIFYGLLYKEQFLSADRRNPDGSQIVSTEMLREFEMHHYFLQSARLPFRFREFFPASIFIFPTQVSNDHRLNFDLRDHWPAMALSVRLGSVGLIAALQDGGTQTLDYSEDLARYQTLTLHPLQFIELSAMFFYKSSLINRTPKYVVSEDDEGVSVIQMPLGGLSAKPMFNEWDKAAYAELLEYQSGLSLDTLFVPPDSVMTWLHGPDGAIRALPWDGKRFL